ncbi:single-stranded-DNA-specific exonuclease RecJ [Bacillus sp. FJAT-47783]|uniref:single-stranded-DNA-specific exonuclease RecJ n=1 Tax=Bacillus sp. FJAT-47783 TaxID=2922712 RepID=UPI001FAE41BC|nr:single-stranded-DNA-specific exonuclease RecJ [Bacillus sp. FJAT-47783]
MLQAKKRWHRLDEKDANIEKINQLKTELNLAPLVASLLINRGIDNIDDAKRFLYMKGQPFYDPFLLDGMEKAVERIKKAIEHKEPIMVYGDYDADGVSSTTIMLTVLRRLGAVVDFYIPNRFREGYGPNEQAFRRIHEQGYTLIITVDTGIAAIHEASVAKELGIDVIITDHHEIGPELPDVFAIIHPKKEGSRYPFKDLAGVGVAFKVAHALLGEVPEDLLEIAAIGTIADLVPLYDENRLIAKLGVERLRTSTKVGIQALLKVSGVKASQINEDTVGFALAPRINAVGRLQDADPAVDLLLTDDEVEAENLANEIDQLNKERQQLVQEMTKEAIQEIEENFPIEENPVLIVAKENWNVGVVGIVASKLVEKYYRPTIVLSIDPVTGLAKGSARSIEGYDLYENLSSCRDILPHFGGHPMAAGMTLKLSDIDELRTKLIRLAHEQLTEEDFIPVKPIDIACPLEEVTVEAIEQLQLLSPFGVKNPKPVCLIENVHIAKINRIGSDQSHLKMILEENHYEVDTIGFGYGALIDEIAPTSKVSVVGELSINEWNNRRKPQIMLQDIAVFHWQLFDYRGKSIDQVIKIIPSEDVHFIAFHDDSVKYDLNGNPSSLLKDEFDFEDLDLNNKHVVLLDMPPTVRMLERLLEKGIPKRIYAVFFQASDHFFSTVPTREHFKWFYAFLAKRETFDVKKYGAELAKRKGWTTETIIFMSKVFFELEFVTIKDGVISLIKNARKRDLTQSKTYQEKQQYVELEQLLLYSSYQELKDWFNRKLNIHSENKIYEQQIVSK